MPVFYGIKHIPNITDEVVSVVNNVFCEVTFKTGRCLQLELYNEKYVEIGDVVISYNITDSLIQEGCIQIVLLRNNTLKFYIVVYTHTDDLSLLKIKNREIEYKRNVGIKDILRDSNENS